MLKTYELTQARLSELINNIVDSSNYSLDYIPNKNIIQVLDKSDQLITNLRLPWIMSSFSTLNGLMQNIKDDNFQRLKYIIILIQAGYSAICHCSNGQILEHKLIRKYMVRKKQGKAQITYLHSKGKSRAGSRIRLTQTVEFFEEINEQVNSWIQHDNPTRFLISCSPRLWGLLFQSKIKPKFSKKDQRIFRIPMDIKVPDKSELIRVNSMAQKCIIQSEDSFISNWLENNTQ